MGRGEGGYLNDTLEALVSSMRLINVFLRFVSIGRP